MTTDVLTGPIRKNDLINIAVTGEAPLSGPQRVSPEGTVTLPLLGAIKVVGLSTADATIAIENAFRQKKILLAPRVTVSIIGRLAPTIFLSGAVGKQGRFAITEDTHLNEVLEPAGLQANADLARISLLRGNQRIMINYQTYRSGNDTAEGTNNPLLRDGDKVYVQALASTIGTAKVNGEVSNPQLVSFPIGTTVSQAIQSAGGVTVMADRDQVVVIRNGQQIYVPLKEIQEGKKEKDILLEDKDEIFVRRLVGGLVKITGEIKNPQQINFSAGATAAQVIQQAGGVTDLADLDQIVVIRGGKQLPLPLKEVQEGKKDKDIALEDKDEIFIRKMGRPKVFTVNGGVTKSNSFPYTEPITLSEAIAAAGGLMSGANSKKIVIKRKNEQGQIQMIQRNMTKLEEASFMIQADDIIDVPYPNGPKPNIWTTLRDVSPIFFLFGRRF